jgi:hypothetical protein
MENYNKLIGFTKWKMYRLTGRSQDYLDVLHSAYLRDGDIYKSCLDLLKSSELCYTEASKAMKKFCN